MATDTLETITNNVCTESSNISGTFLWSMDNITSTGYKNFLYEMTNGEKSFYGKFVYGGFVDSNIIKVNSTVTNGFDDFKVDLSNLPLEVWQYASRTLTQDIGLTPEQDTKFLEILSNTTDIASKVWNNPIKELTDLSADVKFVNGTAVYNIDEFKDKADLGNIETKIDGIKNTVDGAVTKIDGVKSTVDSLPSLIDIEASTILAKKADITVVEALLNNVPALADIRAEMINVTFGGLEIANNQLTINDKDGVTIAIFDLFDRNGNPTMNSVYKRVNV